MLDKQEQLKQSLAKTEQEIKQQSLHGNNPDILSCIANLSNDEVFTPPTIANDVLDLLPKELWQDKSATFLDPCSKTGVFLREIVKRLDKGLEQQIPNTQQRINHILKNQVFGIAITELTALLTRRTLYCSKKANGVISLASTLNNDGSHISCFDNSDGNIKFDRIQHSWKNSKCQYCGASQKQFERDESLETHAYQFIHTDKPEELFDMKFDVIIGNPPYQISDGGAQASAKPIYNLFIQQAKKLKPRYLSMIIPARWYAGGKGLDDFRDGMLNDNRLRKLVDYPQAEDCFDGVEIKGGICYFLWDRDNEGGCHIKTMDKDSVVSQTERPLLEDGMDVLLRFNESVEIYKKVKAQNEPNFSSLVSSQKPFGLRTFFRGKKQRTETNPVKIYTTQSIGYINRNDVEQNHDWIDLYKVYVPMAYNAGDNYPHQIIGKPILGVPDTCCSETYLVIGRSKDEKTARSIHSYIQTKFFRFLVMLRKISQHASAKVYQCVPIQDFNQTWTDQKLYKKYKLTQTEIDYIESMIKPMALSDE